ncbi:FAD-binding oxidoreductase [Actinoplanes sp. NPDC026619]|uniref:FAD-binding oxidoreductase n=1 Tax=Actinoplanes sp. NPDC026619 TaxID=3155798 RepID=UPI0033E9677F
MRGRLLARGDQGYEEQRRDAVWNARRPARYPDLILCAADADDVAAGVRLAAERDLKVGIRSGGHSWIANGIRHGGLTLDLSALASIDYDPATQLVSVGPAARSADIDAELERHGRFFPAGHAPSVGVGGFALGGGYGWNARVHGPACLNIVAADVVLADGRLVRADDEVMWALRGAGPGFFGVVVRLHLRTYERPAIHRAVRVFPLAALDEVVAWSQKIAPGLPAALETVVKIGAPPGAAESVVSVVSTAFDDPALLAALDDIGPRPLGGKQPWPLTMREIYAESGAAWSEQGLRWKLDGIWTDGPTVGVVDGVRDMVAGIPGPDSFVFVMPWGHVAAGVPAAWSVQAANYVSPVAAWREARDDARHCAWVTGSMVAMTHLSAGVQFSDADPASRPDHGLSAEAAARLERLRERYDPGRLFNSYLTAADL